MDPQDQNTQQPLQDDPNAGFVPIGGPVGEGFVELVPETPPSSAESLPVQEVYTTPSKPVLSPNQADIEVPVKPAPIKDIAPKIVNKTTAKEHLHKVGPNADDATKRADQEETDFIVQVEDHHKTS